MTLVLVLAVACEAVSEVEEPADHACEQVAGGSPSSLQASSTMDESTTRLPIDGEPYAVSLAEGVAGYLAIDVTEDTAALLFAETALVVTGLYAGAESLGAPLAEPVEACPAAIAEHFDVDFHTPGTWYLQLGPAAIDEVWLLLAPAEGHEHEE